MSAVGLTAAMRKALETRKFSDAMFKRAQEMNFIDEFSNYYPRAHAALSAPRMTQAELEYLEFVEAGHWRTSFSASGSRVRWQCIEKRWIRMFAGASDRLTPSGLKALNDVRAAMGSELWKDMP